MPVIHNTGPEEAETASGELKPCPFVCDGDDIHLVNNAGHAFVRCACCDSDGPSGDTAEEAARLWNTRTPHTTSSAPDERAGLIERLRFQAPDVDLSGLPYAGTMLEAAAALEASSAVEARLGTELETVPADVRRLVMAARAVAFDEPSRGDALHELDVASEAFASRVPWGDEPARALLTPPSTEGEAR